MRSTPEARGATTPSIEPALIETWALAYLGRYASSVENLRRVLRRRVRRRLGPTGVDSIDSAGAAAAGAAIDALVERYRVAGLLDDAAYAAARARSGITRGRSPRRVIGELMAKGVDAADTAAALAALREAEGDPDLAAACVFARRRRLGPFRREPADSSDRLRALAAFARAGFGRAVAERVLACADQAAVAALLAAEC